MGLDMTVSREKDGVKEDLHYWRGHYSLHAWFMGHCFAQKSEGDVPEDYYDFSPHAFLGRIFELTPYYIDKLEQDILNNRMPVIHGESYDEFEQYILKRGANWEDSHAFTHYGTKCPHHPTSDFIKKAREALTDGYRLFYESIS